MVFSGCSISYTNKTDHHDKTEILLKVVLNTVNRQTKPLYCLSIFDLVSDYSLGIFLGNFS